MFHSCMCSFAFIKSRQVCWTSGYFQTFVQNYVNYKLVNSYYSSIISTISLTSVPAEDESGWLLCTDIKTKSLFWSSLDEHIVRL